MDQPDPKALAEARRQDILADQARRANEAASKHATESGPEQTAKRAGDNPGASKSGNAYDYSNLRDLHKLTPHDHKVGARDRTGLDTTAQDRAQPSADQPKPTDANSRLKQQLADADKQVKAATDQHAADVQKLADADKQVKAATDQHAADVQKLADADKQVKAATDQHAADVQKLADADKQVKAATDQHAADVQKLADADKQVKAATDQHAADVQKLADADKQVKAATDQHAADVQKLADADKQVKAATDQHAADVQKLADADKQVKASAEHFPNVERKLSLTLETDKDNPNVKVAAGYDINLARRITVSPALNIGVQKQNGKLQGAGSASIELGVHWLPSASGP